MQPKIAIVDSNTLAVLGLKQMLQNVMPFSIEVDDFGSFEALMSGDAESYVHYFVEQSIVVAHRSFFMEKNHKTIVLTMQRDPSLHLKGFRSLCVSVPEKELVKDLLQLARFGHANGKNLPPMPKSMMRKVLSDREIEVLSLIVQGKLNKEIADLLNISLTTVITHRKNILDKLGIKSVSALTIYAVAHGYVDINQI